MYIFLSVAEQQRTIEVSWGFLIYDMPPKLSEKNKMLEKTCERAGQAVGEEKNKWR